MAQIDSSANLVGYYKERYADNLINLIENEFKAITGSTYKDATPEQLIEYLGEDKK